MHNLMTIENKELRFYSFELNNQNSLFNDSGNYIKLKQIMNSDLETIYHYYLKALNNPNKVSDCELIKNYMQSLNINLDFVIDISHSLDDLEHLMQTKIYPYEIILEGMNNQKILSYFCDNNLLHFDNKIYVKK